MSAIFLSASVPVEGRGDYSKTADPFLIQSAVRELVIAVIRDRQIVWGGHPAITPMIWTICRDLNIDYAGRVILYQSRFFEDRFPEETRHFGNVILVDAVPNSREASLSLMREMMLSRRDLNAAVFIGGMEGVEAEYALFRRFHPDSKVLLVAAPGGAARNLAEHVGAVDKAALDDIDFAHLFRSELSLDVGEERVSRPFADAHKGKGFARPLSLTTSSASGLDEETGQIQLDRRLDDTRSLADKGRAAMPVDPSTSPLWPADSPAAMAHINVLEGIINRLANNSASCKTWCLTLVAALLSFAAATHVPGIVAISLVPVVVFGFMDTMYLAQEKAYRDLYSSTVEKIRTKSYAIGDAYDAKASLSFSRFRSALASWSIFPVYLGLILAYLAASSAGWVVVLTTAPK